ncbi:18496_t:CDS:2 [Funneliformis geosporum]|uniref:18496_t:CDS:1 n=1 Tax=Funneliformis geosporum TaxID=1117311 RepID=A0A9W4WQM7_9GLOM|nr:18496_t:CDS:2 [Funneliformis geosporum]
MKHPNLTMFRLFILLFLLATIVNSYKLTGRTLHTANYQNEKIYFLGGITETANYTNDLFYLDVSIPFTLDSLPIFDLSSNIQIAKHAKATSTVCVDVKEPLIFAFNISVPQWTNANISGLEPVRRSWSSAACNKYAKMYIFAATATMLSDGKIVFLGGQDSKWYSTSDTAVLSLIYKDNKYVFSNQILLLDVSDKNDYKWVTNFTPNTTALELGIIIKAVIVFIFVISIIIYSLYRYKNRSSTNEHTPLLD